MSQEYKPGTPEAFMEKVQPMTAKPTDVNLVAEARAILAKHCNNNPEVLVAFDSNPDVIIAGPLTTEVQRFKLNQFLNTQYACLRGDISTHRGYILSDGDATTWLKMFDTYHAPTMVANSLPVKF